MFVIPQFNIYCNVHDAQYVNGTWVTRDLREVVKCNLSAGARFRQYGFYALSTFEDYTTVIMQLLLPKRTDIRAGAQSANGEQDIVEVPGETGRFYLVMGVDDVGRGFSNEYRCAFIVPLFHGWAVPYL